MFFNVRTGLHVVYVIAAMLIIYGIIECEIIEKIFSNKLFVWLGERSMYLYIVHIPVLWSVVAGTFVVLYTASNEYWYTVAFCFVETVIACFIAAGLLKKISEKKFEPWTKKCVNRIMLRQEAIVSKE